MAQRLVVCGLGSGMDHSLRTVKDLDVELVVVTDRLTHRTSATADRVAMAYPGDAGAVLRALAEAGVRRADGVLSLGFDNPPVISRLAARFGCPGVPEEVALDCTHKDRRLRRLASAGLDTPGFAIADSPVAARTALARVGFPAVVKPVDQTSSIGVCRLESAATAGPLIDQAFALSTAGRVVLEEYLEGTEHTVAGMTVGGRLYVTGVADREYGRKHEFAPYFFEEGDTLPSRLPQPDVDRVVATVERGVRALDLDSGVFNCDVLVTRDGRVVLLEVTCRMTGARIATEVMPLATGAQLLPNAVRLSLGRRVAEDEFAAARQRAVVQRYLPAAGGSVEWVGDLDTMPREEGVYDVFWGMDLRAGAAVPRFRNGDHNLAGVIAAGDTVTEVEALAARTLRRLPLRLRADQATRRSALPGDLDGRDGVGRDGSG